MEPISNVFWLSYIFFHTVALERILRVKSDLVDKFISLILKSFIYELIFFYYIEKNYR